MTNQEQRIAIAEVCGWKAPTLPEVDGLQIAWTTRGQHWLCPKGVLRPAHHMPDYLNDLNAMHEAEKVLTDEQWEEYPHKLHDILHSYDACDSFEGYGRMFLAATAAQRAEAFLRTLGLWKY